MTDSIPKDVLVRFHDQKARPKVVRVYNVNDGWSATPIRGILTYAVAHELSSRGFTSAEARWHGKTRQVSLL